MDLKFEWDETKSTANVKKHGISFEEAINVFSDPNSITIFDAEHSTFEDRFIDIGQSANGRILVVVYIEHSLQVRIISCRKATPAERKQYGQ